MNKHSTCIGILILLLLALCLLAPARFALAQTSLDWPFYGGDLANTRYPNLDQINPSNVANLKVAWIFHTGVPDPKAELEVSPIEVNGTVYITDGHGPVEDHGCQLPGSCGHQHGAAVGQWAGLRRNRRG
jgi:hypothetical protein